MNSKRIIMGVVVAAMTFINTGFDVNTPAGQQEVAVIENDAFQGNFFAIIGDEQPLAYVELRQDSETGRFHFWAWNLSGRQLMLYLIINDRGRKIEPGGIILNKEYNSQKIAQNLRLSYDHEVTFESFVEEIPDDWYL